MHLRPSVLLHSSLATLLCAALGCGGGGGAAPRGGTETGRGGGGDATSGGVIYGAPRKPVEEQAVVAPPATVGVALVGTIEPERGFIDDPFLFDGAGGRLAYVNADAATLAELRVIDLGQGLAQVGAVDISKVTTTPWRIGFTDDGNYFVSAAPPPDGKSTAAIVDGTGKALRSFGPGTDIRLTSRDGHQAIVVYNADPAPKNREKAVTEYRVDLFAVDTGKPIGKKAKLLADKDGKIGKLDLRINHFTDDYQTIVGLAGGTWDAKEDQRSPDEEGWYDAVGGTFSKRTAIPDLLAFAEVHRVLAEHWNEPRFVRYAADLSSLQVAENGALTPIEIEEPLVHYKHTSLESQVDPSGALFFALRINPTNADAVGRQDIDPEYLDLYELPAGATRAIRRARILVDKEYRWRATPEHWVLVERHVGFTRGGKRMDVYRLEASDALK